MRAETCPKKIKYDTLQHAEYHLERFTRQLKRRGQKWKRLQIFECPFCGKFHIGNKRRFVA